MQRWLLSLALLVAAASAHAQDDTTSAKQMFEQGVSAFEAARYQEALDSFLEAYRLKPHPLVRVNIANCYDKLDRPVEAVANFELFLESGAGAPEQRDEVKDAVKRLKKRIGKLVLLVSPDGARVSIDAVDERTAPIKEPITLTAGLHKVSVRLDGYEPVLREVEVRGDATSELALKLTRASATPVAVPLPVEAEPAEPAEGLEPEDEPRPDEPAEQQAADAAPISDIESSEPEHDAGIPSSVWIAGGTTLAFAIAGTITGVLAKSAQQNFDDNRRARYDDMLTATQQEIAWSNAIDASNRAIVLAITTDVLFAGALVGAGVTTYLLLSRDGDDDVSARLTPSVTTKSASLVLDARF
jgi:tetratricopeptide (TPR) repeat protein